jgi:hypothetical protein
VQRPVGKLDQRSQIDSTWRLEGLVVLGWALKRFDIPPHDRLVETTPLWRSIGLLKEDAAREMLANPDLRSRDEIRVLRNRLFTLHWRLRDFHVRPRVFDFAEFARTCDFGPLDITGLPLVEGDLAVAGERIDQAPPDDLASAQSAAVERHRAVNWLWDGPERFSEAGDAT